jgi:hypothetical protein
MNATYERLNTDGAQAANTEQEASLLVRLRGLALGRYENLKRKSPPDQTITHVNTLVSEELKELLKASDRDFKTMLISVQMMEPPWPVA